MTLDLAWSNLFSVSTSLALVATMGYLVGRWRLRAVQKDRDGSQHEIMRALSVAQELESIADRLNKSMSVHLPAVANFTSKLSRLEANHEVTWQELCDRADALLKPAMRLSSEVSHAYAELLQQMSHLSAFADLRTDPLTGVANRRAFDESLASFLKQHTRYGHTVSLATLDIDFFKRVNDANGHLQGDRLLQELAELLKSTLRDCDVVARYGGEEFALLLPHTQLHAACNLTERIRASVQEKLPITVCIGVAESLEHETPSELLARADSALYAAKNAGRNAVYLHEGPSGRIVGIKAAFDRTEPIHTDFDTDLVAVGALEGLED